MRKYICRWSRVNLKAKFWLSEMAKDSSVIATDTAPTLNNSKKSKKTSLRNMCQNFLTTCNIIGVLLSLPTTCGEPWASN